MIKKIIILFSIIFICENTIYSQYKEYIILNNIQKINENNTIIYKYKNIGYSKFYKNEAKVFFIEGEYDSLDVAAEFQLFNDTDSILYLSRYHSCSGCGRIELSNAIYHADSNGVHSVYIMPNTSITLRLIEDCKIRKNFDSIYKKHRNLSFVISINNISYLMYLKFH